MAAEGTQQQVILDHFGARWLHTESFVHVCLASGDYNVSLFPDACKGYSNSNETQEANLHFQKFTLDPQRSVAWWTGGSEVTLKEACSLDVARSLLRQLDWTRS